MSENIATAETNRLHVFFRSLFHTGYQKLKRLKERSRSNSKTDRCPRKFVVYPPVTSLQTLQDLLDRFEWYLPGLSDGRYHLEIPLSGDAQSAKRRIQEREKQLQITRAEKPDLSSRDQLLIHRMSILNIFDPWILSHLERTSIIDPEYFAHHESSNYSLLEYLATPDEEITELTTASRTRFQRFSEEAKEYNRSILFCTGPSIEQTFELDIDYSAFFTVVCNSMVKNHQMLELIEPDLLVFADPVFHFGCSEYAETFRNHMIETVQTFDPWIIIPLERMPLLLNHFPELEKRLIGMPVQSAKFGYHFPTSEDFYVTSTNNILTRFMIPVASSFADKIYFIGSDGRDPDEDYFWQHNPEVQFEGLKKTAFQAHPSFFRDRIYTDYYKKHCQVLEEMIQFGEELGKSYKTITPSKIPALQKRSVKQEEKLN